MTPICSVQDIPDNTSKGFQIEGRLLFIVHKYGKWHAYENHCPHLGIQLEMVPDQFLDHTHSLIQCSMHGALFRIEDGLCISGPCANQSLTAIDIDEKDGFLYLNNDA